MTVSVRAGPDFFFDGGTMGPQSPSYVERAADRELLGELLQGRFCYVLTSRQTGKSSLMARTAWKLRGEGWATAIIDLTEIGKVAVSQEQWYHDVAERMSDQLEMGLKFDEWWQSRRDVSCASRLVRLIDDLAIAAAQRRMAVFMDEIETTLDLPFTDDFFGAIRACYNARSSRPQLERITFCLLGVTSPAELIADPARTPFNIGHPVVLTDFSLDEAGEFAWRLGPDRRTNHAVLARILYWTAGQPYLTQKLCRVAAGLLVRDELTRGSDPDSAVDRLVTDQLLSPGGGRTDAHFQHISHRLTRGAHNAEAMKTYGNIIDGITVSDDPRSAVHIALKLSGLVSPDSTGVLRVRNRLYENLFDRGWAREARLRLAGPGFYVDGGPVPLDSPSYVERPSDGELLARLCDGQACYVLSPPQMGKSSMIRRTAAKLREEGVLAVAVHLADISEYAAAPNPWFYTLAWTMLKELDLALDLEAWWDSNTEGDVGQVFAQFLESVLLRDISGRVVVLVDDADVAVALPFAGEFFRVIRSLNNLRKTDHRLGRLTFALAGTLDPFGPAVDSKQASMAAIGYRIELSEFGEDEVMPLAYGLGVDDDGGRTIMHCVFFWTSGHPYLTQKLCSLVAARIQDEGVGSIHEVGAVVDSLVEEHLLSVQGQLSEPHFQRMSDRLLTVRRPRQMLEEYRRIRQAQSVVDNSQSIAHAALKLSGLVVPRGGRQLRVRNPIYEHVFSLQWVRKVMPAGQLGRIAWIATAALLVGAVSWYWLILPSRYRYVMLTARDECPSDAYRELRQIPGYAHHADGLLVRFALRSEQEGKDALALRAYGDLELGTKSNAVATELLAQFWDRRSLHFEATHTRDQALLCRLKALDAHPTDLRRREAALLVRDDYQWLLLTFRQGAKLPRLSVGYPSVLSGIRLFQRSIAFSPDGKTVMIGGYHRTARLWRTEDGRPASEPLQYVAHLRAVAFSPNGQSLVTGGGDNRARLWRVKDGTPIGRPMQHDSAVYAVAFSPDGRKVVTGAGDGARVWWVDTCEAIGEPLRHEGRYAHIVVAAFSPDGGKIVTGAGDGTVRLWQSGNLEAVGTPLRHEGAVLALTFSPDGDTILTGSADGTARLWQVETLEADGVPLRHEDSVGTVAFSPDGKTVATGSADGTARIWSIDTCDPIGKPLRHGASVLSVAFSPDGDMVLTGSADRTARLWWVADGEAIGVPLRHEGRTFAVAFSPDGESVLTASSDDSARLWRVPSSKPTDRPSEHESKAFAVACTSDGSAIVTSAVALSPDGGIVIAGDVDGTARLWRTESGDPVGEPLRHGGPVSVVAFSPDGSIVVTGSHDGTARLWRAHSGAPIGGPLRHKGLVSAVAFSPDGSTVVTGSEDGTGRLWRTHDGESVGEPLRHRGPISAVSFSPNGKVVLTGSEDRTARLWCADSGTPLSQPMPHKGAVTKAAFCPTGKAIVTAGLFRWARVWLAPSGLAIGKLLRHRRRVSAIAFSPDGRTVATGSVDTTVRLWGMHGGIPISGPLRCGGPVSEVAFCPNGRALFVATNTRLHRVAAAGSAPRIEATRFLYGDWLCTYRFLHESGSPLQVGLRYAADAVVVRTVCFGKPEVEPMRGSPKQLLADWRRKLALSDDEDANIVSLWPPTLPSGGPLVSVEGPLLRSGAVPP